MADIEGSDAPTVKGFRGKEKEVEGQAKREGKVTVGAMCRRRLAVVLVRLKMAETVKIVRHSLSHLPPSCSSYPSQAVTYVEQGHVRVGPDTINDPAFLVTRFVPSLSYNQIKRLLTIRRQHRNMEDFVTWVDTSKLKRHVARYNVSLFLSYPILHSFSCCDTRTGRGRRFRHARSALNRNQPFFVFIPALSTLVLALSSRVVHINARGSEKIN